MSYRAGARKNEKSVLRSLFKFNEGKWTYKVFPRITVYISHSVICVPLWTRNFIGAFRCLCISTGFFNLAAILKGSQKTAVVSPECNFCRWMSLQWDIRCFTTRWITCEFSNFDFLDILPEKADQAKLIKAKHIHYFKQTKIKLGNGSKVVVTFFRNVFCVTAAKARSKLPLGWRKEIFDYCSGINLTSINCHRYYPIRQGFIT